MGRYLQRKYYPAQTQKVTGAGGRDDGLEWRVKWGQRGAGLSCLLALICYVAGQNTATAVLVAIGLIFLVHCITKRLVRDCKTIVARTNVVMILVFGLCIWSIDIAPTG